MFLMNLKKNNILHALLTEILVKNIILNLCNKIINQNQRFLWYLTDFNVKLYVKVR